MACGAPFVGFVLEEAPELAREAAVYARTADVAGFARLIDRLLADPARRAAMGRVGRQLFEEGIAWERQETAYLEIYQRLIRRRHRLDPAATRPDRQLERV